MKFLIAPDSYKDSLSASEVSLIMERSLKNSFPDAVIIKKPLTDGGEGFCQTLTSSSMGKFIPCLSCNSVMKTKKTFYGILNPSIAVLDMQQTCGLEITPLKMRNPLNTTTFGMGLGIKDALKNGCKNFIVGLGGSATNDCGLGILQALGGIFYDANGNVLPVGQGGQTNE